MKGIFMLTGDNQSPSKIIHIFKRCGKHIEGWYEYGPGCPMPISHVLKLKESKHQDQLGAALNHKVVCFTNKSSCILFDYKNLKWICIQEDVPFCNLTSNHNSHLISNLELVEFQTITTMDPVATDVLDLCSTNLYAQCLNCGFGENGLFIVRSQCVYLIDLPPTLKDLRYYTLIRCSPREVMIIGGSYISAYQIFGRKESHNYKVWHGELSNDGINMIWDSSNIGWPEDIWWLRLHQPMCIKLKNNVYIFLSFSRMSFYKLDSLYPKMGKMTCDRYNWKEKKYDCNVFCVPFEFLESNELKSVSNKDETFALIISRKWKRGGNFRQLRSWKNSVKERMWIFNEIDGFIELSNLETTADSDRPLEYEKLLRIE